MSKSSTCFVSVLGEIGLLFKQLNALNANANQVGIRRILLNLYNKSGDGDILNPTIYSKQEDNTNVVHAPAFSLIGETTPDVFYQALNETMIQEGLLPRFLTIEYEGERVKLNKQHSKASPSLQLIEQLSALCAHSLMQISANKPTYIQMDEDAENPADEFNEYCDNQINSTQNGVLEELWNRAHMKVLKLAGLVQVGINPYYPCVCKQAVEWATNIIVYDINKMLKKFESGDVGDKTGEIKQINKIKNAMCEYASTDYFKLSKTSKQSNTAGMHNDKVISLSYLSKRFLKDATFYNDRLNATQALKRTLGTMMENGDVRELNVGDKSKYNTSARLFIISNPGMLKNYLSSS
jgi:hypothetical protein